MSIGVLILRLAVGLTLAAHGAQKLWGWFGGPGLERTGQMMAMLGFVPGRRNAFFAGLAETGGGILLALGLATPAAAAIVFSVMFVAAISVHLKNGFFTQNRGYEFPLLLGLSGLSVSFIGPGQLSLDALLGYAVGGTRWGLIALAVGLIAGTIQLAMRQSVAAPEPSKATATSSGT